MPASTRKLTGAGAGVAGKAKARAAVVDGTVTGEWKARPARTEGSRNRVHTDRPEKGRSKREARRSSPRAPTRVR